MASAALGHVAYTTSESSPSQRSSTFMLSNLDVLFPILSLLCHWQSIRYKGTQLDNLLSRLDVKRFCFMIPLTCISLITLISTSHGQMQVWLKFSTASRESIYTFLVVAWSRHHWAGFNSTYQYWQRWVTMYLTNSEDWWAMNCTWEFCKSNTLNSFWLCRCKVPSQS